MIHDLKVKIYADGANLEHIAELSRHPRIQGFTTNPSLMRQSGIRDYVEFAKEALKLVKTKPISFEVFADDFDEMESQAKEIASWGKNVFVKIPVTNTKGESAEGLIEKITKSGIAVNVTALFTLSQVERILNALQGSTPAIISIFAGRIADAGQDPFPLMKTIAEKIRLRPNVELLWASPREVFNIIQADDAGCQIITLSPDLLKKISLLGKNLEEFSLETVNMFYRDAMAAQYAIPCMMNR